MNSRRAFWFSIVLLLLFVFVLGSLGLYAKEHSLHFPAIKHSHVGTYKVTEFYDGDTFAVSMDGKTEKVRLIGVDTPETHDPRKEVQCYGQAASQFTKSLVGSNPIRLEADPLNTNRDRYGRLLRYAYLPNGQLVNAEIIKQGYGFAYLGFPFSKSTDFKKYQDVAQAANQGLWGICQPIVNDYGGYTSNPAN